MSNVRQQVSIAAVPEELVYMIADALGVGMPPCGVKREDVEAVEIQTFAAGAEQILPVRTFLHAEQAGLVHILTLVPGENPIRSFLIRSKDGGPDNPP